ncbi:hypothetical protein ACO0LM_25705 [Undibacterium sp. Di26W]|uniref:hypothetical protein n=1 Tax=Undibacterium sp. Di26W TaxID=3413035 RepID=UPI003BEF702B
MTTTTTRSDATASTVAVVFQLGVAVDKCYELASDQTLVIEELGDVTIENLTQIEVKCYTDSLTDGHPNFWNTVTNWSDKSFDQSKYKSLVLYTTQPFGAQATIADWNSCDIDRRLELLVAINKEFENEFNKKFSNNAAATASKTLLQQRALLSDTNRARFLEVIGKIFIETSSPSPSDLYTKLLNVRSKGILKKHKQKFVDTLIGYVARLGRPKVQRWEITGEEFDVYLQDLYTLFCRESHTFPSAHYDDFDPTTIPSPSYDHFVQKILDIDHHKHVADAIHHYHTTINTISDLFGDHTIYVKDLLEFKKQVAKKFDLEYDSACLSYEPTINNSKIFYIKVMLSQPPNFRGFEDSPSWFRNGVLHLRMNNHPDQFQWMLQ